MNADSELEKRPFSSPAIPVQSSELRFLYPAVEYIVVGGVGGADQPTGLIIIDSNPMHIQPAPAAYIRKGPTTPDRPKAAANYLLYYREGAFCVR